MAKSKPIRKRPSKKPKRKPVAPRASVSVHQGTADETAAWARRERVARGYLSGKSQYEIARAEQVNQATISRDLAALRELWQANAVRAFGERQAEELAKIDRLEAEAWEAWERSKRPAETSTAEKTTFGKDRRTKSSKTTEWRDGNPTFLTVIERCIERRCKILGLDAPQRHEFNHQMPDLSQVPTSELDRIIAAFGPLFGSTLPPGSDPGAGPALPTA